MGIAADFLAFYDQLFAPEIPGQLVPLSGPRGKLCFCFDV